MNELYCADDEACTPKPVCRWLPSKEKINLYYSYIRETNVGSLQWCYYLHGYLTDIVQCNLCASTGVVVLLAGENFTNENSAKFIFVHSQLSQKINIFRATRNVLKNLPTFIWFVVCSLAHLFYFWLRKSIITVSAKDQILWKML